MEVRSLRALSLVKMGGTSIFQVQGHMCREGSPGPDRVSAEAPGEPNMSWTDEVRRKVEQGPFFSSAISATRGLCVFYGEMCVVVLRSV